MSRYIAICSCVVPTLANAFTFERVSAVGSCDFLIVFFIVGNLSFYLVQSACHQVSFVV